MDRPRSQSPPTESRRAPNLLGHARTDSMRNSIQILPGDQIKIFGAMAEDSYLEISSHFGIYPVEQPIALRGDNFLKKYSSSDNYLCRLIAKH